jgi:hypothetical protein
MRRFLEMMNFIVVAMSFTLATAVVAQDGAAPTAPMATTTAPANPIVSAPGPEKPVSGAPEAKPRRARAISSDVAAQLSAAAPKFTPAAPKPPPTPEEEQPDARDVDKPKNGIIRLPKYIVTQPRPPVLSERAVNTKEGLADLAMKRYLTEGYRALNSFTLPFFGTSPENRAMTMYEEDERLKNMASLSEDARLVGSTDRKQGQYVKRQVNETFARPGDFDWKPIGR